MIAVSIVIPAYNEEQRLPATLAATARFLQATGRPWEIVVSDDGSTDGTVAVAERVAREHPQVRVVRTFPNRGKGHAVRVGMLAATGAIRVMCDADGAMPASELPRLLGPLQAGAAEVAIGSRRVGQARNRTQPAWRRAWSRLVGAVVRRTLVPGVRDTQCGYKAFTARAAVALFGRATIDGWAFDLEVLALADRCGLRVVEVGIAWTDDRRSRVDPLRDLGRVLGEALRIRRNLDRDLYGLARAS